MRGVQQSMVAALLLAALLPGCSATDAARTENLCDDPRIVAEFNARGFHPSHCGSHQTYTYRDFFGEREIQVVYVPVRMRQAGDVIYIDSDFLVRFSDNALANWGEVRPFTDAGDYHIREMLDAYAGMINCCRPRSNIYRTYLERQDGGLCTVFEMKHPFEGVVRDCGGWRRVSGAARYVPGAVTWRQAHEIAASRFLADLGLPIRDRSNSHMFVTFQRDADGTPYYLAELHEPSLRTAATTGRAGRGFVLAAWRIEVMGGKTRFLGIREGEPGG